MFEEVEAISYLRTLSTGRTRPILLWCDAQAENGETIDVVAKLSAGCDLAEKGLIREAFAAFLASDLGLPTPTPYRVVLSDEFIATIPDANAQDLARKSCHIAFGSRYFEGWSTIPTSNALTSPALLARAAEIFTFDAMIGNGDRRQSKPNCLTNTVDIAILDHEAAFSHCEVLLGPKYPWEQGVITTGIGTEPHVFYQGLKGHQCDLSDIESKMGGIDIARISEYAAAIPPEWSNDAHIAELVDYLQQVQKNLAQILQVVLRVLA